MKHVSAAPPPAPVPVISRRSRERNFAHGLLFACNILATLALLGALALLFAYPEKMAQFHLTEQMTQMLTLNLISLLLLVAWLQRNLAGAWRAFTVAGAFIVLAESWLVGLT